MAQIFQRSTNFISKLTILGAAFIVISGGAGAWTYYQSSWNTRKHMTLEQPVPFSHEHHVRVLGIECRYCHTTVDVGAFAGIPPVKTCMTCHSQVWKDSPMLEPVRESYRSKKPIQWVRVHDLPEHVFFNHAIHVNRGITCAQCHGEVARMPLVYQDKSLLMRWCVDCHRGQEVRSTLHMDAKTRQPHPMMDCMVCHR